MSKSGRRILCQRIQKWQSQLQLEIIDGTAGRQCVQKRFRIGNYISYGLTEKLLLTQSLRCRRNFFSFIGTYLIEIECLFHKISGIGIFSCNLQRCDNSVSINSVNTLFISRPAACTCWGIKLVTVMPGVVLTSSK